MASRLRLSPTHDSRKRPASCSPSPCRIGSRKKSHLAAKEVGPSTSKRISRGELIERRKGAEEGRLSYEDEDAGDIAQHPPVKPTPSSPADEGRDAAALNISCDERAQNEDHAEIERQWECAVLQMIREESVKTDLLHVNGIDRPSFACTFGGAVFRNKESIWVNRTVNKFRPSAVEFYSMTDEPKQQVEGASCEIRVGEEAATCSKETDISSEHVANRGVIEPEQIHLPSAGEGDVEMDDEELAANTATRLNAANWQIVATMGLGAEALLCNTEEKENESRASQASSADGVCSTEKAISGAGQATTSGDSRRIMDIENEGARRSPHHRPILGPAMERLPTADGGTPAIRNASPHLLSTLI
ncbi:hypothetical protein VTH06DRAFT_6066 [Thermothelomyces fergusii]